MMSFLQKKVKPHNCCPTSTGTTFGTNFLLDAEV